jgi:hypothetical protein
MVIEDVTGESFAGFMHREVTAPLGLNTLQWNWTPELEAAAPMPYGDLQEPVEYRQLGCQAVGSEICSVPDFARFVAAAVAGPRGEPAGRGVLRPETMAQMLEIQTNSDGSGLGYGVWLANGDKFLAHFGANPGWNAHFFLDASRREGFVVANNSMLGFSFNVAVQKLWSKTVLGVDAGADPPFTEGATVPINRIALRITLVFWGMLLPTVVWLGRQISCGKRRWGWPPGWLRLLAVLPSVVVMMLWSWCFYAPRNMPLPLGPAFPSIWRLPLIDYVTTILLGSVGVSLLFAFFPRRQPSPDIQPPDAGSTIKLKPYKNE